MSNTISEEIVHVNGTPQKLVIFLHGYIDSADYVEGKISYLLDNLHNTAVHLPQAPIPCEVYEAKRQWYSMHRFDPDDTRKTVPTMDEFRAIYEKMKPGIIEAAEYVNRYIDDCLEQYGLDNGDLYICGFSQGATLAIFLSLMRDSQIGGCVSFSGVMAPHSYLASHYRSAPDFLLIHGTKDNLLRFEALDYTKTRLREMGCAVSEYVIDEGMHRITEDGVAQALAFIEGRSIKKVAI